MLHQYNFGDALELIKHGKNLTRKEWNQVPSPVVRDRIGLAFVFLVPGSTFRVSRAPLLGIFSEGTEINYRPHIDMRDTSGKVGVWSPTQQDILADDWVVAEEFMEHLCG